MFIRVEGRRSPVSTAWPAQSLETPLLMFETLHYDVLAKLWHLRNKKEKRKSCSVSRVKNYIHSSSTWCCVARHKDSTIWGWSWGYWVHAKQLTSWSSGPLWTDGKSERLQHLKHGKQRRRKPVGTLTKPDQTPRRYVSVCFVRCVATCTRYTHRLLKPKCAGSC